MKTKNEKFSILKSILFAAFCLMMVFSVASPPAHAAESFAITNVIADGDSYTTYPTNAAGLKTGSWVDIRNYDDIGLLFKCDYYTTNATHTLTFNFVGSAWETPPGSVTNWDTGTTFSVVVTLPSGTNTYLLTTNLDYTICRRFNYIGIKGISEGMTGGEVVSNAAWTVTKKIIPIRLGPY